MAVDYSTDSNRVRRLTLQVDNPTNRAPDSNNVLTPTVVMGRNDYGFLLQVEVKGINPTGSANEVVDIPDARRTIYIETTISTATFAGTFNSETKLLLSREAQFTSNGNDGLIEIEIKENDKIPVGTHRVYASIGDDDFIMTTEKGNLIVY